MAHLKIASVMMAAGLALTACLDAAAPPTVTPQVRPTGLIPPAPKPQPPQETSQESRALSAYYGRVQGELLAQGLLRQDGGGPDTPFTTAMLVRNFTRIAFFDEYERGAGLQAARGTPGVLRRWSGPVRLTVEFGKSVPAAQRTRDRATVAGYAARLKNITGHPIGMSDASPNFHVLVMGEDDRAQAIPRVLEIVPNINPASLSILRNIPRSIHCLVIAFSSDQNDHEYRRAIALVRAEHPDLLRKSCMHEEIAQGLGLANDSPQARPSIFNDDDEFALLTTHDEMLLRMLYSPRLRGGMGPEEAQPILRELANEMIGGDS